MQFNLFDPHGPESRFWTVGNLTRHIKDWIESDTWLADCTVQGEVSNFSRPSSGHIYFTLKDSSAQLKCVMWRTQASRMRESIKDGDLVEVHGAVTVYELAGQYQLIVDSIQHAGEGYLFQEFVRLKAALETEGLFSPERKRTLPSMPRRIGIVTSPTGAAIQDMLQTITRRFPVVEVIFAPAVVQGAVAAESIVAALSSLLQQPDQPDVILLARGGGSMEDLWCFNDETLVRFIAHSPVPIVTGIGHETDFTLADFAADLRAPTPTAAAEIATPDQIELRVYQQGYSNRLYEIMTQFIQQSRSDLATSRNRLQHYSPEAHINNGRQLCDHHLHRLDQSCRSTLRLHRSTVNAIKARLAAINPYAVLDRGYSIVKQAETGEIISSLDQVKVELNLSIRVRDGEFAARVSK